MVFSAEQHGFPHLSEARIAILATTLVEYDWHDRTPSFDRLCTTCPAVQA